MTSHITLLDSIWAFVSTDPVASLIGTLIGAFVGFGLVILWDRSKKKTERKETRNLIIDSLIEEMEQNLSGANEYQMPTWDKNEGQFRGEFGLTSTSAFQSIVNGGDFVMLPTTLQTGVNEIYQHAELFNKFMDDIIEVKTFELPDPDRSKLATESIGRLQEQKTSLQTKIPNIVTELKSLKK